MNYAISCQLLGDASKQVGSYCFAVSKIKEPSGASPAAPVFSEREELGQREHIGGDQKRGQRIDARELEDSEIGPPVQRVHDLVKRGKSKGDDGQDRGRGGESMAQGRTLEPIVPSLVALAQSR